MKLVIPELSLVVLIGASGSGKSTFARKHFKPTEILSSDYCRGLVSDDENSMEATGAAFEVLGYIAGKRLAAGKLTVVDATNVKDEDRGWLVDLAREYHCLPTAIVLDLPERVCNERNQLRPDRLMGAHVVRNHISALRRSLRTLEREGFRRIHHLRSLEEIDAVEIERQPLWNDKRSERGPFDIFGDIHGCYDELLALMGRLGYEVEETREEGIEPRIRVAPPEGRKAIFLGDLVDRGPKTPQTLRLAMGMAEAGQAYCVPGNHDIKLMRKLRGKDVQIRHGLAESLAQLEGETAEFRAKVAGFLDGLVSHYVFDGGALVVAHAGMKESMQGRGSGKVRDFALYGETTGETDAFGLPVRVNWAAEYRGRAAVVYGHTPVPEAEWLNNTINIDTGCVFGGKLTALRWPEKELTSIEAAKVYSEPVRPLAPAAETRPAQQTQDDLLDLEDASGKRLIQTRLHGAVTIREENSTAALEAMSRFAVNPKWLIYMPPTMSPTESTIREGLLEHPDEAFAYYRKTGVETAVCEKKHMGSRAVVVICRDKGAARSRFGVSEDEGTGIIYTRTGRRFFNDAALEKEMLSRIGQTATAAGLWERLQTDWLCLDCELMPWSAKAQDLLKKQYAPVGAAAIAATDAIAAALKLAADRGIDVAELVSRTEKRSECAAKYDKAWREYCWPVSSIDDLRLAPFHLLASEGTVHCDKSHVWHMETLSRLAAAAPELIVATEFLVVELNDPSSAEKGCVWWEALTASGGEGMVVKPLDFVASGKRGLIQPAVKCRGPEYLRIIYGPEYLLPENLERLRRRGVSRKRSLAAREFALGIEGLERFVRREPLRRIHECAFGVLALESEPVDPRL